MKSGPDSMLRPSSPASEFDPITAASAKAILNVKFSKAVIAKVNKLAALNSKGELSEDDRDLLMHYVQLGNLLGLLHAKARLVLKQTSPPKRRKSA